MLKVDALNQYYGGSHILRDISFTSPSVKTTCLLGRNGVRQRSPAQMLMKTKSGSGEIV